MKNCSKCQKRFFVKMMASAMNIKPKYIISELHLSQSVVIRYLFGQKDMLNIHYIKKLNSTKNIPTIFDGDKPYNKNIENK